MGIACGRFAGSLPRRLSELETAGDGPGEFPERIGRYLIEYRVGGGAFGDVFRAYDTRLDRVVALKWLREISLPGAQQSMELEAQTLASLDHPGIVPIYDVGEFEGRIFIVSKFLSGGTLRERMTLPDRPGADEATRLVAKVAAALDYAHDQGRVHRDINPGNLMLDGDGQPVIVDFGLTRSIGSGGTDWGRRLGTPPYVSPEQIRGEGHQVSGQSDQFSLGVVFYELLTGSPPFEGATVELLGDVAELPVVPPRQLDPTIPEGLERLCLKALARLPGDRFATAGMMAEALITCLEGRSPTREVSSDQRVVPRGLRAFDRGDAEFFLELLPGVRDAAGLPPAVAFWKPRIEDTGGERCFRVGLLYGASGCGKSSLVAAGLLPNLSPGVNASLIDAGVGDAVGQIARSIHRQFPRLDGEPDLVKLLGRIREGEGPPLGSKLLLVIDQFEQHLHAHGDGDHELLRALRQCDGGRVQALLMVRSEYWIGVSRFLEKLEVDLDTGGNAALVDLFEPSHGRRVLEKFGRAYRVLPPLGEPLERSQERFLDRAIEQLTEDGKIYPIRLAIFAEMVKEHEWNAAALKDLGGVEGIGVRFLEESLGDRRAERVGGRVEKAAQGVLQSLLPSGDLEIRGVSRTWGELAEAAGLDSSDRSFQALMDRLENELRLLRRLGDDRDDVGEAGARYQFTHDYLVPSVRTWLEREQEKSLRGRTRMKLERATRMWCATNDRRLLPSGLLWLQVMLFTRRRERSSQQRRLISATGWYHARRAAVVALLAGGLFLIGRDASNRRGAADFTADLVAGDISQVQGIVAERGGEYGRHTEGTLRQWLERPDLTRPERLNALLGLAVLDPGMRPRLGEEILRADPHEIGPIDQVAGDLGPGVKQAVATVLGDADSSQREVRRALMIDYLMQPGSGEKAAALAASLVGLKPDLLGRWLEPVAHEQSGLASALGQLVEVPDREGDPGAQRSAKAAAALILLGREREGWAILSDPPSEDARSFFIHWTGLAGIPIETVLGSLRDRDTAEGGEGEEAEIAGLLQTLGNYVDEPIGEHRRLGLLDTVGRIYSTSNRARVYASAAYALRAWGGDLESFQRSDPPRISRELREGDWFMGANGHEMVVLPEVDGRVVAIAMYELSNRQYRAVVPDYQPHERVSPFEDSPAVLIHLKDGLRYCNRLSAPPGMQPCYQGDDQGNLPFDSWADRHGYRLPTPEEWRIGCIAGSGARRFMGNTEDVGVIGAYAWFRSNCTEVAQPVGTRRPNAFGLFDTFGNASEWVHNGGDFHQGGTRARFFGSSFRDRAVTLKILDDSIPIQGGSIPDASDDRTFRLALTLIPAPREEAD